MKIRGVTKNDLPARPKGRRMQLAMSRNWCYRVHVSCLDPFDVAYVPEDES